MNPDAPSFSFGGAETSAFVPGGAPPAAAPVSLKLPPPKPKGQDDFKAMLAEKKAAKKAAEDAAAAEKQAGVDAAAAKTAAAAAKVAEPAEDWEAEADKAAEKVGAVSLDAPTAAAADVDGAGFDEADDAPMTAEEAKEVAAIERAEKMARGGAAPPAKEDTRKHVNTVFIGHVDAGKSTICGQIMWLSGNLDERTMEKMERDAIAKGRESWKFAYAMDTNEEERDKGKTVECGRAYFQTEKKRFTILDAPGHKNFVPHMIGGAAQADVAILVISARKGEFETGFERSGQTREHAMLVRTAGVKQLVVLVNKMDEPSIVEEGGVWSRPRFDEICQKLNPFLKKTGFNPKSDIIYIPASGLTGINIKDVVSKEICPWYKPRPPLMSGLSFFDTLDQMRQPKRVLEHPIRLPIIDKFRDMGTCVMGKLEAGIMQVGDKVIIMPNKTETKVEAIFEDTREVQSGEPGDNLRVRLQGITESQLRPGYVLCGSAADGPPCNTTREFDAKLTIMEHKSIICGGYTGVLHLSALVEEVTLVRLIKSLDKKTGKVTNEGKAPKFVKSGDNCIARFRVDSGSICAEKYTDFSALGRFMLRDEGKTIAVGLILKTDKDFAKNKGAAAAAGGGGGKGKGRK